MRIGILYSIIRPEEKLLIKVARSRNIELKLINIEKEIFNPETYQADFDLVLDRSVSRVKGIYAIRFFESLGISTVNTYAVTNLCADKFTTSLILQKNKIPTLKFALVFNQEQALEVIREQLGGFPVVIKPTQGSWGRLLAKVNDQNALEAVLEHKEILGSPQHKVFYLQEYVEKPGRDIRAFVIDGKTICAIYRNSPHWITNTARGGKATDCPVTKELTELCRRASEVVGGGVLAMDIFETNQGLKIDEINPTPEFRNSEKPTGVSISGAIIDYCLKIIEKK